MRVRRLIAVALLAGAALATLRAQAQTVSTICRDGTPAAIGGRGSCSDHGGVDLHATQVASRAAIHAIVAQRGPFPCADGTTSPSHSSGACAHHGGVRITTVSTGDIGHVPDPGGGVSYQLPVLAQFPRATTPPPTPFEQAHASVRVSPSAASTTAVHTRKKPAVNANAKHGHTSHTRSTHAHTAHPHASHPHPSRAHAKAKVGVKAHHPASKLPLPKPRQGQ
jgi:hypothetical protein